MSKGQIVEFQTHGQIKKGVESDSYISKEGLEIKIVNGEPLVRMDQMEALICKKIGEMPMETRPNVLAAQDARKVISDLLYGIGDEMMKFRDKSKEYLEEIRQTKYAVVRECGEMTRELKDLRQFFLGSDYKQQVERLSEFAALCERLKALKDSGFLDSVADTMLKLSTDQPGAAEPHQPPAQA